MSCFFGEVHAVRGGGFADAEVQAISRMALFLRKRVSEAPVVLQAGRHACTQDAFAEAYAGPEQKSFRIPAVTGGKFGRGFCGEFMPCGVGRAVPLARAGEGNRPCGRLLRGIAHCAERTAMHAYAGLTLRRLCRNKSENM